MKKIMVIAVLVFMAAASALSLTGVAFADEAVTAVVPAAAEAAQAAGEVANQIPMPPEKAPWWFNLLTDLLGQFPDINGWLIAVLMFLSVVLRGVAELLGFIAQKTKGTGDDKAAGYVSMAALWAGALLGWFGGGKPKQVEKAKEKAT